VTSFAAGYPAGHSAGPRLAVGVIGVGRVGAVLGAALDRAGHPVVAASGVSAASVRRAERFLPGVELRPPDEVAALSDLILIAVPDDDLPDLIAGLAVTGTLRAGQMMMHTSGAHGLDVLAPAAELGVMPMALHPAMTFTGRPEDVERLVGAVFGITAYPDYRPVAETLVLEMGGEPVWVPDAARPLYHAALSHAANHLVTLICDASDLLARAGVEQPTKMLSPLVTAALENALRLGDAALTGPVSRGDVATVRGHLQALRERDPAIVDSYQAMARRTAVRAFDSHRIDSDRLVTLVNALEPDDGHE
jgi:predicted short-subunit dehydrogenase-like oxidoreductase (DUF2520 family)